MGKKTSAILASAAVILAILACNAPASQTANQPDLVATITAQALELQATSESTPTPATAETAQGEATAEPASPQPPENTPKPAAPSKPKNFQANGSASAIQFSWDDNSLNETGFRLYQDGVAAPVATLDAHAATGGMSYNLSGLSCGFKAKYYVRSFNDAGESSSSNTKDGVTIPCQPTNLVEQPSGNAILLNWSVGTTHNEAGFRIYQQGTSAAVASRGPNLGSGGTIYNLIDLPCNLVGTYYVTAFNSAGESPGSNLVQSETVPCGPSGLTITGTSHDAVTYSWTDNSTNETGYRVYVDDVLYVAMPAHAGTGAMSSDAFQVCNSTHVYSIRAFNYAGESTVSEHVGATTPAC